MQLPVNRKKPYALKEGEGWTYLSGIEMTVKAGEIQEGSSAAFMEYETKQGEEPDPHTHATEDEMFYVLAGEVTFRCGGDTFDLEKGDFIFLPRGIEHAYTINSDDPARLIVVTSPVREGFSGGWGGFIGEMESGDAGELVSKPPKSRLPKKDPN